jgi:hypothetical protein
MYRTVRSLLPVSFICYSVNDLNFASVGVLSVEIMLGNGTLVTFQWRNTGNSINILLFIVSYACLGLPDPDPFVRAGPEPDTDLFVRGTDPY